MGCKKTTVKVLKRVAGEITPALVGFAVDAVGVVDAAASADPGFWSDERKRRTTAEAIRGRAKSLDVELRQRTVNLLTEFAVELVHGPDDEAEVGRDDLAEREEV